MKFLIMSIFFMIFTNLNAEIEIKIIKYNKEIKKFNISEEEMEKTFESKYFENIKILKVEKEIKLEDFKYGVKIKIKKVDKTDNKYILIISYIVLNKNFSDKDLYINKFQKTRTFKPMKENSNSYHFEIKNKFQKTHIRLGEVYNITFYKK